MRDLAALIKAASHRDLQQLAEAAGFRHAFGRKLHCIHGEDRTPSAYLYPDHVHCFVCGRSWDPMDLEQEATGCTVREAARRLAARYGIGDTSSSSRQPQQPSFTSDDHAYAQLFKTGMVWALEQLLASLKELLWLDEECAPAVQRYTQFLSAVRGWSQYEATEYFVEFRKRQPAAAEHIMARPVAFQKLIAQLLARAGQAAKEGKAA